MQDSDRHLLEEFRSRGSHDAFAQLVRRHMGMVYHACRRRLRDEHLAEDAAQAVFVLLSRRGPGDGCPSVAGWLYRTALHTCANVNKARMRRERHERTAAEMRSEIASAPQSSEMDVALERALGELPATDRDVLIMKFYEQRELSEVAQALGISSNTATKRVSRALARMKRRLVGAGVAGVSIEQTLHGALSQPAPTALVERTIESVTISAAPPAVETIVNGVSIMLATTKAKLIGFSAVCVVLGGALVSMTAILLAQAPAERGQPAAQAPATQPAATPKEVVKQFAGAIRRHDASTIKDLVFVANPDEERLVQTVCDYLTATGEFKAAVTARFGPDGQKLLTALSAMTPVDRLPAVIDAMMNNVEESVTDTEAILQSEQANVTFVLTNDAGRWRISTTRMTETWSPEDWETREGQIRLAGEAMQMLTQKIEQGDYASVDELKQEIAAMFGQGR